METQQQQESCVLTRKGRRVMLFPLPFQGHINPMLQLASILYSKGFSITIIHTNFPNSSNYPHFEFHSISDSMLKGESFDIDAIAFVRSINAKCIAPLQEALAKLMMLKEAEEDSFACIITDSFWYFVHEVANEFKLPTIVLHTQGVAGFIGLAAYPTLREKGYLPIQDSQSEAPVIEFPPLRVKDIPTFKMQNPENLDEVMSAVVSQIKASSGMIWNSFQDLEQVELTKIHQQYPTIPAFPIGPFHKYFPASPSSSLQLQDQNSISWLDKQAPKSVIYVSFGSIADIEETEFLEIAWGLANSRVPFLWAVRPGIVHGAEWLESLPKGFLEMLNGRGYIVKWAPQQEVLSHDAIGGFWTHGGWNSTLESICEGVPMICLPFLGDQMVNARYIGSIWRVGLHLEGKVERRMIERAIIRVVIETEGQKMSERIVHLKEKVNACVRHGGSSSQSLERLIDYISSF